MPTSTATMTSPGRAHSSSVLSLNSKPMTTAAESSTAATLRSLYSRAAKAFLHRDFALTSSLLSSAFTLIAPPTYSPDDEIASFRRKWDILRITVETTVYCSPPSPNGPDTLPEELRANQLLSPQSLVTMLHARSMKLFTPSSPPQKPLPVFLPHQVLITLILSSIKFACYDFGRSIIEDWLAGRQQDYTKDGHAGYSKVIELYCLHVLPKLEEWEYAQEFLTFERELQDSVRLNMKRTLQSMFQERTESRNARLPSISSNIEELSPSSTRPVSPAQSASSDSTTSTHTATPLTPRPLAGKDNNRSKAVHGSLDGLSRLTPSPALSEASSSQSLTSVTTSATVTPNTVARSRSTSRRRLGGNSRASSAPKSDAVALQTTATVSPPHSSASGSRIVRAPSTLAVVRSYIDNVRHNATKSKIMMYFVVFVVFPAISLAVRIRRSKLRLAHAGQEAVGAADVVRRRLRGAATGPLPSGSLLGSLWNEVSGAVMDTIRMGGGGLA